VARASACEQRLRDVAAQRVQRGRECGEEPHAGRDDDRERERAQVQRDAGHRGKRRGPQRHHRAHGGRRQRQAEQRRQQRQQQPLEQHLPDQPPLREAECYAHGDLARARLRARQQQARRVEAGEQQHARDPAGDRDERAARARDALLAKRRDPRAPALVLARMLLGQPRGHGTQLRLGFLDADAGRQAAEDVQEPVIARRPVEEAWAGAVVRQIRAPHVPRQPHLRLSLGIAKRAGITPATRHSAPSSERLRPIAAGSAPKRRRHSPSLITSSRSPDL
jgi:hypothetical protein